MIPYGEGLSLKMLLGTRGSALPYASMFALPSALLAAVLKHWHSNMEDDSKSMWDTKSAVYSAFTSIVAFLVIFRNSQAYNRYLAGGTLLQQMGGSWFDAASSLMAFTRVSKKSPEEVHRFRHSMMRMFSLLNSISLLELASAAQRASDEAFHLGKAQQLSAMDAEGLDEEVMSALSNVKHHLQAEACYHWIQVSFIKALDSGLVAVPPPIATRFFSQLDSGLVKFEDAKKIALMPFPFPYAQVNLWLMILHLVVTPYYMAIFTHSPVHAACCTFVLEVALWALVKVSAELENPFGSDENDFDLSTFQDHHNKKLLLLLEQWSCGMVSMDDGIPDEQLLSRAAHKTLCVNAFLHNAVMERSCTEFYRDDTLETDDDEETSLASGLKSSPLQSNMAACLPANCRQPLFKPIPNGSDKESEQAERIFASPAVHSRQPPLAVESQPTASIGIGARTRGHHRADSTESVQKQSSTRTTATIGEVYTVSPPSETARLSQTPCCKTAASKSTTTLSRVDDALPTKSTSLHPVTCEWSSVRSATGGLE